MPAAPSPPARTPLAVCNVRAVVVLAILSLLLVSCGLEFDRPPETSGVPTSPRTIGALQGSAARSPFEGQRLQIQGIVTGNFVSGLGGFFLQDAVNEVDGDPRTSDGIFVQWDPDSEPGVRRGDRVRVSAVVREIGDGPITQTVLADSRVEVLGRGAAAATVVGKPPATAADWSQLEGMWLRIEAPLTVTGNDGLLRFGELAVAFHGRLFQPTELHPPGPQARALQAANERQMLWLDDNRLGEYPDSLWYLDPPLGAERPLRLGSLLAGAEGLLERRRGRWVLQLSQPLAVAEQAPRPAVPILPAGLRIGAFNVLNFFNGDGAGGGFPTARGARSAAELARQRSKLVAALRAADADILALMEIENDGFAADSALAELVDALNATGKSGSGNAEAAGESYRFIEVDGGTGDDEIRVALVYRDDRAEPVGDPAVLDGEGGFGKLHRVPLAQRFRSRSDGLDFTIAVQHWKSKGGCQEAHNSDRDQGDGQACWNASRVEAARALDAWLRSDPVAAGHQRTLIIGDLNSYAQEDPLRWLRGAGWRDAFALAGRSRPYSYVYGGQAGRLDHLLVSPALAGAVRDALSWHVNADESEAFDYRLANRQQEWFREGPYRSSDHDPLLLVLRAP